MIKTGDRPLRPGDTIGILGGGQLGVAGVTALGRRVHDFADVHLHAPR